MEKFAICKKCLDVGKPSGFHSVGIDVEKRHIKIYCSTCGEVVVSFDLSEKVKEELNENKIGT